MHGIEELNKHAWPEPTPHVGEQIRGFRQIEAMLSASHHRPVVLPLSQAVDCSAETYSFPVLPKCNFKGAGSPTYIHGSDLQ